MTQTITLMASLYQRLEEMGFNEQFIRYYALPQWWDSEVESEPEAFLEAAAYISRRLNLDVRSLLNTDSQPVFKQGCQSFFKTKPGTQREQLIIAECLAQRVGEMVAYACVPPLKPLPNNAQGIRSEILQTNDYVSLEGLVTWCWQQGLPVVYFDGFPMTKEVHQFHGMIAYCDERPVIIISLKDSSTARLLLILAHELGHLIKGHLQEGALVDEEVNLENLDPEEIEANEFAVELLLGKPALFEPTSPYFTGEQLAGYAQSISQRAQVAPGVVALNYAYGTAKMAKTEPEKALILATANQALKLIEGETNAARLINYYLAKNLDLDRLDEDSQAYLELIIGG